MSVWTGRACANEALHLCGWSFTIYGIKWTKLQCLDARLGRLDLMDAQTVKFI
jgi:hypothetical protein